MFADTPAEKERRILFTGELSRDSSAYKLLGESGDFELYESVLTENIYSFIEKNHINLIIINYSQLPDNFEQLIEQLKEICNNRNLPVLFIFSPNIKDVSFIFDFFQHSDLLFTPFNYSELKWRIDKLFLSIKNHSKLVAVEEALSAYKNQLDKLNDMFSRSVPAFAPYAVSSEEQIEKGIKVFLRQICDGVGAETALLLTFDSREKELVLEATPVKELEKIEKSTFQFDDPLLASTAQNFQITLVDEADKLEDSSFASKVSEIIKNQVFSLILVPLVLNLKLYGIIVIVNKIRGRYFTQLDKNFTLLAATFFSRVMHDMEVFKKATESGKIADLASPFVSHLFEKMEFINSIMDSVLFGIVVLNQYNDIIYMNKSAERILQRSFDDLKDENFSVLFGEKFLMEHLSQTGESGTGVHRFETEVELPDGSTSLIGFSSQLHLNFLSQPVGKIITMRDISMFLLREKELMRMDQLASLGVLISGIAHEIRNPLAGINAVAQALEEELKREGNDKSEYVERIIRQVNRLNNLLQALFVYSRHDRPTIRNIDLNDILNEVKPLLENAIKDKDILYQEYLDHGKLVIPADPNLMQQMLLNLMLNAIEAMREKGVLTITMEYVSKVPENVVGKMNYIQRQLLNEAVRITVADTGEGIPEKNLKELFTPFYTTKSTGTGLGLSIVQQIVDKHRGFIEVFSEKDKGTRFCVYLPLKRLDIDQKAV